jgi:hypothetical protein
MVVGSRKNLDIPIHCFISEEGDLVGAEAALRKCTGRNACRVTTARTMWTRSGGGTAAASTTVSVVGGTTRPGVREHEHEGGAGRRNPF